KAKLLKSEAIDLGAFEVVSGEVALCDPGYDRTLVLEGAIATRVGNVARGRWQARVLRLTLDSAEAVYCGELLAFSDSVPIPADPAWQQIHPDIGVDSGQAGIFDWQHFHSPAAAVGHQWKGKMLVPTDPWYSLCCDITLSDHGAGVIPHGVVSSSGWGDGG